MKQSLRTLPLSATLVPLLTGATVGLQLMLIAMLLTVCGQSTSKPAATVSAIHSLGAGAAKTHVGKLAATDAVNVINIGQEHDVGIYVLFSVFTLLAMSVLVRRNVTRCRMNELGAAERNADLKAQATLRYVLLAVTWALFLGLFSAIRMPAVVGQFPLPLVTLVLCVPLVLYGLFLRIISRKLLAPAKKKAEIEASAPADAPTPDSAAPDEPAWQEWFHVSPGKLRLFDIAAVIVIFAFVFVPDTHLLSTHTFRRDEFHHWNYFAMGPTLGFSHGRALGTDVYCQYGVGWPMVFSFLAPLRPVSYGHMMQLGSLYGCFYFAGLYILLRMLLKNPAWAACGVLWAWYLQFFQSGDTTDVIWEFPSSSVMRAPVDIWMFIALLMHARTRNAKWLLGAAAALGLSILFELDTSIYLVVVAGVYSLLMAWQEWGTSHRVGKSLAGVASSGLLCAAVVLAGLWLASRGTLASSAFWTGWLEAVLGALSPDGSVALLLPLATYPDMLALTLFVIITLTYLLFIGAEAGRLLLGEPESKADGRVIVCIACYGLMSMMLFIGRSHPLNLFHPIIPFCIVSTCAVAWARERLLVAPAGRHKVSTRLIRSAPVVLPLVVVALILRSPSYRIYGSAFKSLGGGNQAMYASLGTNPNGGCLLNELHDVCGLGAKEKHYFQPFDAITGKMLALAHGRNKVAVLDDSDTILYVATGIAPWPRYSPLIPSMAPRRLKVFLQKLKSSPPDYVLIRGTADHTRFFNTKTPWTTVHAALPGRFELNGHVGPFEIWRRRENRLIAKAL